MKSCQVADCVLGICFIATIWLVFFFEKNMKSTCIILRMVYIIYRNKFLLRGFLFHALLNVNTDLRIWCSSEDFWDMSIETCSQKSFSLVIVDQLF